MANLLQPNNLKSIPNNGAFFTRNPGAGEGTVRVPFVDLFLKGQNIPLIDAGSHFESNISSSDLSNRKPVLLLLDFNYRLTSFFGYGNQVTLTILDPQYDYLASLLMNNDSSNAEFSIRFGWRGIDDKVGGRHPPLFITNFSVVQNNGFEGIRYELRGVDAGFALYRKEVSHAFDPKRSISDVIEEVILRTDSRLVPQVESITTPIGEGHSRMENVTPYNYILSLLQVASGGPDATSDYRAVVTAGASGKSNVIITSDKIGDKVTRRYIFGRERQGTMIEFRPQVEGEFYLAAGAAKAIARSVDAGTKKVAVRTSTQQEDTSTEQWKVNETPIEPGKVYMVPWQNPEQVEGFIQGMRQMMDTHTMYADAVVHGDTGLLPLDQISIIALRSGVPGQIETIADSSILFTSGVYKLESVEHIISAGMFRTLMHMYRNSAPFGAEAVVSKKSVDDSLKDPGADMVETPIT